MPLDFAVSRLWEGALLMPLHGARNYRKLVGDVYNYCGFNPRPFYATSRRLVASFTNRTYVSFDSYRGFKQLYRFVCRIVSSQVKWRYKVRNFYP